MTTDYDRVNPVTKDEAINEFREYLEQYEKKCHLPLPDQGEIIRRSIIEVQRNDPLISFINLREKTKTRIQVNHRSFMAQDLHTADRLK